MRKLASSDNEPGKDRKAFEIGAQAMIWLALGIVSNWILLLSELTEQYVGREDHRRHSAHAYVRSPISI